MKKLPFVLLTVLVLNGCTLTFGVKKDLNYANSNAHVESGIDVFRVAPYWTHISF